MGVLLKAWLEMVMKNSRAMTLIGCTIVIVVESWVVIALYNERNKTNDKLLTYKEECTSEKITIIYNAIQAQDLANGRNEAKIESLYERLSEINLRVENNTKLIKTKKTQ